MCTSEMKYSWKADAPAGARQLVSCWRKIPRDPSINRLRIIHLFEADYNLFLKFIWAQRLVQQGERFGQFGEVQQGSRQGRRTNDAVVLYRLTYNLTRQQRSNLGTFNNDAKCCYDRIINRLAMLAARQLGMPPSSLHIIAPSQS